EYNLTPTLGIYLEPGVSHHFNNHSDIQNIYKDKPWNFNLNFGFRLNIK
ncbi:MAG: RNA polymerase, partial [Prevotellaceae bacterium]|nr:RNA polymerase [Prevotellaceae bacterium]